MKCPVCGKPRGSGPGLATHGACAEGLVKIDVAKGQEVVGVYPSGKLRLEDHAKHSKRNENARKYSTGKLPPWMFD